MVHVTHDRDHRRTHHLGVGGINRFFQHILGRFYVHDLGLDAIPFGKDHGGIRVHLLVLRRHDAIGHQFLDNIAHLLTNDLGELFYGAAFLDLDDLFPWLRYIGNIGLRSIPVIFFVRPFARGQGFKIRQFLE